MGFKHYRIDNDLGSWIPGLGAIGVVESYAIVGYERSAFTESEIVSSLAELPSVGFCLNARSVEQFGRARGLTLESFVVSEDGMYAGIFVFRRRGFDDDVFVRQIRGALGEYETGMRRFALAGPAVFHVSLNECSQQRLPIIILLINVMGGVWLWWIIGSCRSAMTGVLAILLSQCVLLGLLSWQHIPVDMSLSMVPPLVMALGYSYAAHRALRREVAGTLLLCCGTTAAGIASVGISDLAPLRMFALCGALGMALVWLAVVTLLPAPKEVGRSHRARKRWLEPLLRGNLAIVARHRKTVVWSAVAVTFGSVAAMPHLKYETNPLSYFPSDSRMTHDSSTIEERLTGTLPFQVTVTGSADPTALLLRTTGVRKVVNVSDVVPGNQSTYWGLARSHAIPGLVAAQEEWQAWADAHHVQLQWRGVAAQINATATILRRVAIVTLPVMGLIAALLIGGLTHSFKMAMVAAWVNLLPICGLVLIAAITELPIGLPSLMIGAIAVGMAIDDTIHLVCAFRRATETARGLIRCWRPCVGSTFVAASCMGLFSISPFLPTRQFGVVLAATAVFALAVDMLLLPILYTLSSTRPSRSKLESA